MSYPCIKYGGECSGCMACREEAEEYYCPVCGEETTEALYILDGEIVGCENCITIKEPWEVLGE